MQYTLSSYITTMLLGTILIALLYIVSNGKRWFNKANYKVLLLFTFLIVIRILIPIETPFTYSIYLTEYFPALIHGLSEPRFNIGSFQVSILSILIGIWVVGAALLLGKYLNKYYSFWRIIKNHSKKSVKDILNETEALPIKNIDIVSVIQTNKIHIPAVTGIIKPTILLPSGNYSQEELCYIFSHELQHFKNHDILWQVLLEIFNSIYWWNPLVYFLSNQISNFLELRVDANLTDNWDEMERLKYVECLIKVNKESLKYKEPKLLHSMSLVNANKSFLRKRADYILKPDRKYFQISAIAIVLVLFILSFSIVFEPSSITDEQAEGTFELSQDSYILQKSDGTYYLYMDGEEIGSIENPNTDDFKDMPRYRSESEVQ